MKANDDIEFQYKGFAEPVCNNFEKDKVDFCCEYCRVNIQFRCHPINMVKIEPFIIGCLCNTMMVICIHANLLLAFQEVKMDSKDIF